MFTCLFLKHLLTLLINRDKADYGCLYRQLLLMVLNTLKLYSTSVYVSEPLRQSCSHCAGYSSAGPLLLAYIISLTIEIGI